jgi:glycerol-3-phosphate acyltransferase PlsY
MLELGTKFLLAYFLGSIMGSLVIGRLRGGIDIRTMGSGNAGGTNALRTQGWAFAIGVIVIDLGKGAVAAGIVPELSLPFVTEDPYISRTWLTLCCAAAAVLGHVWPIGQHFKGGKGAATLIGTLTVIAPGLVLPVLLVWVGFLVFLGYVGLATMAASVAAPVYLILVRLPDDQPLTMYAIVLAAFMIFTHRANIQRMRDGTEPQNTRLMLFRRSRSK